jgi:hypothetical protein
MAVRFRKQYVLSSDNHDFVTRVYKLRLVAFHFDSYEDLAKHADCKYAYDVNDVLSSLTRRVESLNMVGDMFWPSAMPKDIKEFPVSRYEWLTISADVFLARYISVVDCAIILVNEILECQTAFKTDPGSASNIDPSRLCSRTGGEARSVQLAQRVAA